VTRCIARQSAGLVGPRNDAGLGDSVGCLVSCFMCVIFTSTLLPVQSISGAGVAGCGARQPSKPDSSYCLTLLAAGCDMVGYF
jgi:hypothetical protein